MANSAWFYGAAFGARAAEDAGARRRGMSMRRVAIGVARIVRAGDARDGWAARRCSRIDVVEVDDLPSLIGSGSFAQKPERPGRAIAGTAMGCLAAQRHRSRFPNDTAGTQSLPPDQGQRLSLWLSVSSRTSALPGLPIFRLGPALSLFLCVSVWTRLQQSFSSGDSAATDGATLAPRDCALS